ncbi:MAG: DUF3152 domain-containing protein [Propionibacteriaceae bacterium]|nr:DUF3152 domain-containing protein [Propionibacteriaceae bacterium]
MTDTPRERTPAASGRLRPTARFWWVVFVAILAVLGMIWGWMSQRPPEAYTPAPPAVSQEPTPTPTPAIPEIARQEVWTSDTQASGEYLTNTITLEPGLEAPEVVDYVLQVEDTTELDADEVAREVQAVFDDERGWAGYGRRTFRLVADTESADLTIYITSPDTSDELCKPLDTGGKWNCRVEGRVVLNSDRWKYMTPTYDDLGTYRSYLVNHEVGHFLGQGHVGCPAEGAVAPVMMQQSIALDGCVPNAWPRDAD